MSTWVSVAQNSVLSWPISGTMDLAPTNCWVKGGQHRVPVGERDLVPSAEPGPKEEGRGHSIPRAAVPSPVLPLRTHPYCVVSLAPGWALLATMF